MADADFKDVAEQIGSELEFLLPRLGLELPEGITGAQFLTEVLEGAPGIDRDPALFSWFGVKILNATMRDEIHPDLASELRARIAQLERQRGEDSNSGGASA